MDGAAFRETLANARQALLGARGANGCWEGELSSSALSTATAVFTLHLLGRPEHRRLIDSGLDWLIRTQNVDGGWGDTVLSFSNVSTTALCWSALSVGEGNALAEATVRAEKWLTRAAGNLTPDALRQTIIARYGKDRTFSVPIVTMLTLAGRLGPAREAWRQVPQLPFELAACPHKWFQWIRLPVVSYALPALIAIGHVRHCHSPTWNPLFRLLRALTHGKTLEVLRSTQPASGGFLEATPLTSFVCMSLIAAGQAEHPVVALGVEFLEKSALPDGSWPIDTNLATWVTTLSVNALNGSAASLCESVAEGECRKIGDWLLQQQYCVEHPFTHAAPGGWAWTDLSGGVPDADDTPGALLALSRLRGADEQTVSAVRLGLTWLLGLQNRDGGMPTFCRGWGALPFDRSSADLTAHAILAWSAWRYSLSEDLRRRIDTATERGIRYLMRVQRPDGAWEPLWFGNQHAVDVANLTYGTSRVVRLAGLQLSEIGHRLEWSTRLRRGIAWLLAAKNADGGWGGSAGTPSSIEETALAVESLAIVLSSAGANGREGLLCPPSGSEQPLSRVAISSAMASGVSWLVARTAHGRQFPPAPIGFYFANLWYFEKLYPLIFVVAALTRAQEALRLPVS
jgi:squalene-hopene/tetraprenyl-beta-curcumene cyclase